MWYDNLLRGIEQGGENIASGMRYGTNLKANKFWQDQAEKKRETALQAEHDYQAGLHDKAVREEDALHQKRLKEANLESYKALDLQKVNHALEVMDQLGSGGKTPYFDNPDKVRSELLAKRARIQAGAFDYGNEDAVTPEFHAGMQKYVDAQVAKAAAKEAREARADEALAAERFANAESKKNDEYGIYKGRIQPRKSLLAMSKVLGTSKLDPDTGQRYTEYPPEYINAITNGMSYPEAQQTIGRMRVAATAPFLSPDAPGYSGNPTAAPAPLPAQSQPSDLPTGATLIPGVVAPDGSNRPLYHWTDASGEHYGSSTTGVDPLMLDRTRYFRNLNQTAKAERDSLAADEYKRNQLMRAIPESQMAQ